VEDPPKEGRLKVSIKTKADRETSFTLNSMGLLKNNQAM